MFEIEGSKCPICNDGILKADRSSGDLILITPDQKNTRHSLIVRAYICNNCEYTALKKRK